MKRFFSFILLLTLPWTGEAQRKWSINLEGLTKRNFKYSERSAAYNNDNFLCAAPPQLGLFLLCGYQLNDKMQLTAGIGISPSKYILDFTVHNDTVKYEQIISANVVALKFPLRLQYNLSKKILLGGGITVNYNSDWSRGYTDDVAVDIPPVNIDYHADYTFFDKDYLTISTELLFKYRLSKRFDVFAIGSIDFGKQPTIAVQNTITTENSSTIYSCKTDPRLFYLGIGITCRVW